jgi:hypothetical protein
VNTGQWHEDHAFGREREQYPMNADRDCTEIEALRQEREKR